MPKLSIYTDPKRLSSFIHRFWDAVTLLEDRTEVVTFFKDLLSPTEIRMLAKRLQIADMLSKGYDYQTIKNYIRVTSQTISVVNNKLNYGADGLIPILKKLEKIDQRRQDRLEGKRDLFSQSPGLGRAAANLATLGVAKMVRHHKKISSVKSNRS